MPTQRSIPLQPRSLHARLVWARVRDSLWFIPTLCTVGAAVLAAATVRVSVLEVMPEVLRRELLFGGGAEGATAVLTAIAGSLITVTGTVFSVTIVALQLAGSQYTPRVVRSFLADRPNQVVLGIFIGTFTYALLVLRTVHGPEGNDPGFVPAFAVTVAVGLVALSIGALIFFINHAARSIQVSVILERETRRTMRRIAEVFPGTLANAPAPGADDPLVLPAPLQGVEVAAIRAREGGYIAAVHVPSLVAAAAHADVTVRMTRRVGEYVIAGEDVAEAWPAARCDADAAHAVRDAVMLGPERTPEQDPEFGIIEISDIAVRAMSAAINDPTTAMLCVDRLAELLAYLALRELPAPPARDHRGVPRFVPLGTTFDRALGLAYDQLRYSASANPAVMRKLVDTIGRLRELVPPIHHAALDAHVGAVLRATRHEMPNPADAGAVRDLAQRRLQEAKEAVADAGPGADGRPGA
jgi:uncharacterized membrane protein